MAFGRYATMGGHSVWLDHGFAKLDVPFGYRLGYTIGMSTLEGPIWGAWKCALYYVVLRPLLSILQSTLSTVGLKHLHTSHTHTQL